MKNYLEQLHEYQASWMDFAASNESSQNVIAAFGQMRNACCSDNAPLDLKTLELISIAVAVARKCEPCILSHIEVAVDIGIKREELASALNTAILLCGGPGWAYSAFALKAYDSMVEAKK